VVERVSDVFDREWPYQITFYTPILSDGSLYEIKKWCVDNLKGDWSYFSRGSFFEVFVFDDHTDVIFFKMNFEC
jgi:hypothetical protein